MAKARSVLSLFALAFLVGCGAGGGGVTPDTLAASIKAASQAGADQQAASGYQPGALVKSVTCEPIQANHTLCTAEAEISGGTYAVTARITVSGDHWTSTSPSGGQTGTGTIGGGPWTSTTSDGTRLSGTAGGG